MKKRTIAGVVLALGLVSGGAVWGVQTNKIQAEVPGLAAKLTMDEAKAIAEKETGSVVEGIDLDRTITGPVYEVDLDGYDVDIDGSTGDILKNEREDDDDDSPDTTSVPVTQEEAISEALKKVKGEVTEIELDDGHYEIEIRHGKTESDVLVNGTTGEVIVETTDLDD
ncbi:PepSY domain-containing protein [Domibacillus epiphyticus]|uniref:PepSY domain-containing protein n=1 Tax=Domibacillus epiphyticus TaxID=1714355 RepID=A0A1V2A6X0_9BACI|nr:PepSY domain-containing protein [Domibacillus epiphyticus]OMP66751.1 hypothetical protein BTO28_10645 [Domibacillus epiphyticus]